MNKGGGVFARAGDCAAEASERRADDEQQAVDVSCRDQRPEQGNCGVAAMSSANGTGQESTSPPSAAPGSSRKVTRRRRSCQPVTIRLESAPMLNQIADGVWVRQSEWVWSNAIVVRGEDGLILVDPGIDGADLNQLADDVDRLGIPVVAGFSTHTHWDHLLWHSRFGEVPRYATPAGAHAASQARERAQRMAAESASGIPLE